MTKKLKLSKEKNDAIVRVAKALAKAYWAGKLNYDDLKNGFDPTLNAVTDAAAEMAKGQWFKESMQALKLI